MAAYSTQADIEVRFGVDNVKQWADLNGNGNPTEITDRIAAAIAYADERINDEVRGGAYTVPFTTIPLTITDASANIAAVWLYNARPRSDNATGKGFDELLQRSMKYLGRVREARVRLDLVHSGTVPLVVKDC